MKQPRFRTGAKVLVHKQGEPSGWAEVTVIKTWLAAPDGIVRWNHNRHSLDEAVMGYTVVDTTQERPHPASGQYGVDISEVGWDIVSAVPNPRRDCWSGESEIRTRGELQLLAHDFALALNGTDSGLHGEVTIVRDGQRITVEVWRLMRMAVDTQTHDTD